MNCNQRLGKAYSLICSVGAVVLFFAGTAKLWSVGPQFLFGTLVLPRLAVLSIGALECCLSLFYLIAKSSKLPTYCLTLTYGIFLLVLLGKSIGGASKCNCIPGFETPVFTMVAFDLTIFIGALAKSISSSTCEYGLGYFRGFCLASGVCSVVLSTLFATFEQSLGYFSGESLLVDQSQKTAIYDGDSLDVPFTVTNVGPEQRRLIGARFSCGCTTMDNLPVSIHPNGSFTANMHVDKIAAEGVRNFVGFLYRDDGSAIRVQLTVVFREKEFGQ